MEAHYTVYNGMGASNLKGCSFLQLWISLAKIVVQTLRYGRRPMVETSYNNAILQRGRFM